MLVDRQVFDAMIRAARTALPLEACGLCGDDEGHITHFYQLTNADASSEHYSMTPEEQFAAIKRMRAQNLRLLAIWHSHPATPARMSEEDLRLAFTLDTVYLITSLADIERPDLRGYLVEEGAPKPVTITIVDPKRD